MFRSTLLALGALVALAPAAAGAHPKTSDADAVRQMMAGYIDAWKRADPKLIAANFKADGDFINPTGFHATGHAAIAAFYAQAFAAGYKGSDAGFTAETTRQIAPGVMVIDGEWYITGAHELDGKPRADERGLATAVLVKTRAGWRIAVLREQSSASKIMS
ncbi:SgcJ/EcaC family oxidoreductase [Phenylobacterium sp.]|uniref:SgcJ/EcaC family oxidoreductase n=1 Tax=Phenylobacterium sp. TaxID=1871053 RepID=UPI00356B2F9D